MKKLLTILLALLVVTGVVFADDPAEGTFSSTQGGEATLILKSSVAGVFQHGFASGLPGQDQSWSLGNKTENLLDMVSANTGIGYYVVITNASTPVNVSFQLNAMTNTLTEETEEDDAVIAYVPYLLTITEDGELRDGTRFSLVDGISSMGKANKWNTDIDTAWGSGTVTQADVIASSASGGSGTMVLELKASFSEHNSDLPEGDYEGTIVATLTVI